jgi:[ribosomal protein S18]-alanine N-acetyltransferase
MAEVVFEIMQDWHLPTVYEMEKQIFKGEEWSLDQFKSELHHVPETRMYWVAKVDGRVIGYAGVIVIDEVADIATIAVSPEFRGIGLGSQFMRMIFAESRYRGANRIMLEVRVNNLHAIEIYKKYGFQILIERPNYYGPGKDAYMMELAELPGADHV